MLQQQQNPTKAEGGVRLMPPLRMARAAKAAVQTGLHVADSMQQHFLPKRQNCWGRSVSFREVKQGASTCSGSYRRDQGRSWM
mmetsp:Transcript_541/g.1061  ORF Transcript_541/g.1061 Transcript_541/m.1061 type:complete len:83 (-) Transcript_541:1050-1298(-)